MNTIRSPKRPRTYNVRPNSLFPQILEVAGPPSPKHNRSSQSTSMSNSTPGTSSAPSTTRPAAPALSNSRKRSAAEISRERQYSDSV